MMRDVPSSTPKWTHNSPGAGFSENKCELSATQANLHRRLSLRMGKYNWQKKSPLRDNGTVTRVTWQPVEEG